MRQAGIIAAGALLGLEQHRDRLVEDHRRAKALAQGLARHAAFRVAEERVESNIVMAEVEGIDAAVLVEAAAAQGLRFLATGPHRLRFVTHLDLQPDAIERALAILDRVLSSLADSSTQVGVDVFR
jgi:threonine aldolase